MGAGTANTAMTNKSDRWLPSVPGAEIEGIFRDAPGSEIDSGKFDSPESSAALAANAFGLFLHRAGDLPPFPGCGRIEETVRFPGSGGRRPVLDILIVAPTALIGVESKRFEPFRGAKSANFSRAYWRPVWGGRGRIDETMKTRHQEEIAAFASYCALLADWLKSGKPEVRAHAENVIERYAP